MVRESGISATRPSFPRYLLPSLTPSFLSRRRASKDSDSSEDDFIPASSSGEEEEEAQEDGRASSAPRQRDEAGSGGGGKKTSRIAQPDTIRCLDCSAHLAYASQIISKGFTGRHGRAFLVAPPAATQSATPPGADPRDLLNIRVGRSESRQLVTGWHTVADISCDVCDRKVGWKYVDARDLGQRYKVGKFILETERVVTWRSWDGVAAPAASASDGRKGGQPSGADGEGGEEEGRVSFDSEDDDECNELFVGLWDAETIAERRRTGQRRVRHWGI
ncbi:hypothetical protein N3K66_004426 [Trichothecium roseum]|uniref:Uncharacterized protein n=1 Tax=Trichothecium roseum TaxID=47278 RepID=A0ACC0V188_9HYPO|nr:hypothetical protein N3K66_004426 [Trichothecium roseum]